jgi:hypothetical protein
MLGTVYPSPRFRVEAVLVCFFASGLAADSLCVLKSLKKAQTGVVRRFPSSQGYMGFPMHWVLGRMPCVRESTG